MKGVCPHHSLDLEGVLCVQEYPLHCIGSVPHDRFPCYIGVVDSTPLCQHRRNLSDPRKRPLNETLIGFRLHNRGSRVFSPGSRIVLGKQMYDLWRIFR